MRLLHISNSPNYFNHTKALELIPPLSKMNIIRYFEVKMPSERKAINEPIDCTMWDSISAYPTGLYGSLKG
jgi:hypothetical protein